MKLLPPSGLYTRALNLPAWVGLAIFLFVFISLVSRQLVQPGGYLNGSEETTAIHNLERPLQIIITETQKAHDEVVAPLIEAFGSLPNVNISAILLSRNNRFGSLEMYRTLKVPILIPEPLDIYKNLNETLHSNPPDIIVTTSCGYDDFDKYRFLLARKTHIFCTVHHADQWKPDYLRNYFEGKGAFRKKLSPWIKEGGRVTFLTLSSHVGKSLNNSLSLWDEFSKGNRTIPPIHIFPPVMTIDHPPIDQEGGQINFALQGNYESSRRNFGMVFREMALMKNDTKELNSDGSSSSKSVMLHLVGSGSRKPNIPASVRDVVQFNEHLDYIDFYDLLSGMTAILPAFADDDYYKFKASSTVPSGLIAGAPIVANRRLLDAYSYVDEEAVWLQGNEQRDEEFLMDIFKAPREQRLAKTEKARGLAAKIIAENKVNVAEWVNDVFKTGS